MAVELKNVIGTALGVAAVAAPVVVPGIIGSKISENIFGDNKIAKLAGTVIFASAGLKLTQEFFDDALDAGKYVKGTVSKDASVTDCLGKFAKAFAENVGVIGGVSEHDSLSVC